MDDLDPFSFDDSGDVEIDWDGGEDDVSAFASTENYRTGEFAGKVTNTSGDTYVKRNDGSVHRAKTGDILIKGDIVVTKGGSKVEVRRPQGDRVRIGSNTAWDTGSGRSKSGGGAVIGVAG